LSTSVVSQNSALWSYEASDSTLANSPQLVVGSAMFVYQVEIDNTANTSAASYVKLYDDNGSSSVTVGTSVPMAILVAPAATKISITFPYGIGTYFANGIVWACVAEPGTAGTTSPTSAVIAKIMYNAS
jgi:hypothetical protein